MDLLLVFMFVVLLPLFLVIFVYKFFKRTKEIRKIATSLGLSFKKKEKIHKSFLEFAFFHRGSIKQARNVMRGQYQGHQVIVADYTYGHRSHNTDSNSSSSNSSRRGQSPTIFIISDPQTSLPHAYLRLEDPVYDRIGALLGGEDFDFRDDPEFSKSFVLQGDDEAATRALFTPAVRKAFLIRKKKRWSDAIEMEVAGKTMLIHWGHAIPAKEIKSSLDSALTLRKVLGGSRQKRARQGAPAPRRRPPGP